MGFLSAGRERTDDSCSMTLLKLVGTPCEHRTTKAYN